MRSLQRAALWLLTSLVPVAIAACYGVRGQYLAVQGWCVDKASGHGIGGIEVRTRGTAPPLEQTVTTESSGAFYLGELDPAIERVDFTDVDGPANGGSYAPRSFPAAAVPDRVEMVPAATSASR